MMKYSLVVTAYNPNLEWLRDALASAEGLFDELILVDDCSTVPVPGATIRLPVNSNCFAAKNAGVAKATGDVVMCFDDDDVLIRECVIHLRHMIENIPALQSSDVWHFPVLLFGERCDIWAHQFNFQQFLWANQIPAGSWFRKALWEELGGFQYPDAEDWDFWVRAYIRSARFSYAQFPIYRHRVRSDSHSAVRQHKLQEQHKEIERRAKEFAASRGIPFLVK